ncbi:50S ribosomal protein L11 methyltransferase [Ihubacter sp. rT4E-8]|uniref:50S ribosomal protein L11 methyltransferase n=1 Tax=Ihubacter sp. rT4E-8 TaxID=3242369 RepID=UPI00137B5FB3
MKYIEIDIETTSSGIEAVVSALLAIGITDTVVEDPRDVEDLMEKKQTYDWDYLDDEVIAKLQDAPKVTVYLEDTEENRLRIQEIEEAMGILAKGVSRGDFGDAADFGSLQVTTSYDDDSEWKDKWKEYFKPSRISESLVVKPTWESYEREDGDLVLEIDPGMAFGTGTHETTSLCVRMLEAYQKKGDKVLDVGCGSGILSIAAALLGAEDVLGVDIDPVAVDVARENIALNHVENICRAEYGDLTKGIDYKANIVVANLMADLVMMLSGDVARHMTADGFFISSGILVEKEEQVVDCLREKGFSIVEIREDGGWCCITAKL